jgi:hypothetical protein
MRTPKGPEPERLKAMAAIITAIGASPNETLITNTTPGAGGGQGGEVVMNEDAAELSLVYRLKLSSGWIRFMSRERLAFNAAAATSGAKRIGYFPTSPLTATDVQAALDQLAGMTGGGSGGIGGALTTGKIPKASAANALVDSILSEVSGKILFSGDTVANLYRSGAGILTTDGILNAGSSIVSGSSIAAAGSVAAGTFLAGAGLSNSGYMASPIITTAAATLTLGADHVVRTEHASPTITVPDSTTVAAGTEYYVYTWQKGCTFNLSGSDVLRGLNRDLGLGIEDAAVTLTYIAPRDGFMLKTDGAGHWYIWEF